MTYAEKNKLFGELVDWVELQNPSFRFMNETREKLQQLADTLAFFGYEPKGKS